LLLLWYFFNAMQLLQRLALHLSAAPAVTQKPKGLKNVFNYEQLLIIILICSSICL
jgi:hypothetical protein